MTSQINSLSLIVLFTVQDDIRQEDPNESDGYDGVYEEDLVINTSPHTEVNVRRENIGPEPTEIITSSKNPYYSIGTSNEIDGGNIENIIDGYLS